MLKNIEQIKSKLKSKKIIAIIAVVILVLALAFFVVKKLYNPAPKKIYEVAVMARSQNSSDPEEDARTSLKYGDVLMAKEEGKRWSTTELVSYIILKMTLTEDQAQKLTLAKEKELTKEEIKKEMENFKEGREDVPEEEIESYENELKQRKETLVMRMYQIDMEKYFPDFKPNDLLSGQPFQNEIYDWSIVKKK